LKRIADALEELTLALIENIKKAQAAADAEPRDSC
jgi:hypothetical protein